MFAGGRESTKCILEHQLTNSLLASSPSHLLTSTFRRETDNDGQQMEQPKKEKKKRRKEEKKKKETKRVFMPRREEWRCVGIRPAFVSAMSVYSHCSPSPE